MHPESAVDTTIAHSIAELRECAEQLDRPINKDLVALIREEIFHERERTLVRFSIICHIMSGLRDINLLYVRIEYEDANTKLSLFDSADIYGGIIDSISNVQNIRMVTELFENFFITPTVPTKIVELIKSTRYTNIIVEPESRLRYSGDDDIRIELYTSHCTFDFIFSYKITNTVQNDDRSLKSRYAGRTFANKYLWEYGDYYEIRVRPYMQYARRLTTRLHLRDIVNELRGYSTTVAELGSE
jgi:hypothetical protein